QQGIRKTMRVLVPRCKIIFAVALLVFIYCIVEHRVVAPVYHTTLKLRVEASPPPVAGFDQNLPAAFDPVFLHRQCVVLRSPAVIRTVAIDMKLAQEWGVSEEEAVNMLLRQISARPTREQDLLVLEVGGTDPARTAAIADAV